MKHRSIQHTEWPIGYVPPPKPTAPDYNKRMKQFSNRFNNWCLFIKKQNHN